MAQAREHGATRRLGAGVAGRSPRLEKDVIIGSSGVRTHSDLGMTYTPHVRGAVHALMRARRPCRLGFLEENCRGSGRIPGPFG